MASSLGGVVGSLLSGIAMDRFSPQTNFLMFGVLVAIQLLLTVRVRETSLHLPQNPNSRGGIAERLSDLWLALKRPEIAYSILWFMASNAMIPDLGRKMKTQTGRSKKQRGGTMFFNLLMDSFQSSSTNSSS